MTGAWSLPVVVVGGGIAGAACAGELAASGMAVRLLDRGREVGGRLASRRWSDGSGAPRPVDLGAAYLTADDDDFAAVVRGWEAAGTARPWTDTFTVLGDDAGPHDKQGPLRWGTPGGSRSLVEALVAALPDAVEVTPGEVTRVDRDAGGTLRVDGAPAAAVVLAMPDPQAARLLGHGLDDVTAALRREWEPTLALAARWEERTWDAASPSGRFHGAFCTDPDVSFVADDGRRRGDDAPVLVAHSTPELGARHLDDPDGAAPELFAALDRLLDVATPPEWFVHRWTFAKPTGERTEPYLLREGVGVCGDGWGATSKVQTAWLSGRDLGRTLARKLAG